MGEGACPPPPHGRTGALASSTALVRTGPGKEGVEEGGGLAARRETGACPQTSAHSLLLGTEKQPGCGCAPTSPWCPLWLPPLPLGSLRSLRLFVSRLWAEGVFDKKVVAWGWIEGGRQKMGGVTDQC